MAKRLNVSLAMTADSSQAKAELNKLQLQLENLMKSAIKSSSLGLTKDIREGVEAAAKLKVMFQQATDESGKLNLDKFNIALKSSGQSLSKYADKLIAMGPEGSKAFSQIARSIMNAEIPLKRTNAMLSEFATTLKNTVRWQISSSVLHGFMGSLQSAYGYAQNLDESLNNIRIVTNKSTDEMAKFAIEANKSAQALSTTTTRYAEAALIFYQQGLEGKDVTDRTDTVIKMANVTGEAAKDVSSYMTAIWNNFDDGSQSIEHYADVLTALGAATASSTAEISAGLEKFASIADVTGLSYDYATSALATLIANTRQSADVVGTSLKTIFSRIEGLKFGETLEDGVDLNKYSEALAKIGVNVLDVTGNLKDLDDILDDTAERWGTLSRAQQMATAQTVAGVRQYNNFISLMDNWDDMEDNLQTAKTSDGTLQEQADIYADSWEAARNRVRAAAEEIYNALLDEKFFISLLNAFEKILNTVKNTIDGLGGLPGVLTWVAAAMLQAFGPQISKQISDTWYNLTYSTEKAEADLEKLRKTVINTMQSFSGFDNYSTTMADVFRITSEAQDAFLVKNQELQAKGLEMDTLAKQEIQTRLSQVDTMGEEISKIAEKRQAEEEEINTLKQRMAIEAGQKSYDTNIKSQIESLQHLSQANSILTKRVLEFKGAMDSLKKGGWTSLKETMLPSIQALQDSFKDLGTQGNKSLEDVKEALMKLPIAANTTEDEMKAALDTLWDSLDVLTQDSQKLANSLRETFKSPQDAKALNDLLDQMISHFSTLGNLTDEESQKLENLKKIQGELKEQIKNAQAESVKFATGLVTLAQGLSSIAMTIQSIQSLGSIWNDDDKTTGEKILATMTTMGMIVPILTRTFSAQNIVKLAGLKIDKQKFASDLKAATALTINNKLLGQNTNSKIKNKLATILEAKATDGATASLWKYIAAQMVANWYYLVIVAAIGVLIGVVYLLVKAHNAEAEAMKQAEETAEGLTDKYESLKQANEDFLSSFNDYHTAADKLKILTEGTEEYAEALNAANEEAIKLLNSNNNLEYHRDNGLIVFDNEDQVAQAMAHQANMAQMAMYAGQVKSTDKHSQASVKDINEIFDSDFQNISNWDADMNRMKSSGYTSDSRHLQHAVTDTWDGNKFDFSQLNASDTKDLLNAYGGKLSLQEIEDVFNSDRVDGLTDAIISNTAALEDNSKQIDIFQEEMVALSLQDNEKYNDLSGGEKDAVIQMGAAQNRFSAEEIETAKSKYHTDSGADAIAVAKQYATQTNLHYASSDKKGETHTFTDGNGNTLTFTNDELVTTLATEDLQRQYDAQEDKDIETVQNANNYFSQFGSINKLTQQDSTSGIQSGLLSFAGGQEGSFDLTKVSPEDLENLQKYVKVLNDFDDTDAWEEDNKEGGLLDQLFGKDRSGFYEMQEMFNSIGIDTEKLSAKIIQLSKDEDTYFEAYYANLQQGSQERINQVNTAISAIMKGDELDAETIAALEAQYSELSTIWDKTSQQYLEMLQKVADQEEKALSDGYEKSLEYYWNRAQKALAEYNGTVEDSVEDIDAMQQALEKVFEATENYNRSVTNDLLTDVDNIVNSAKSAADATAILREGFTVTNEDAKTLLEMYPAMAHNAKITADGLLKLDEEIVRSVLESNGLRIDSDTNVTANAIQNRIAELEAEKSATQAKLDNIGDAALTEEQIQDLLGKNYQELIEGEIEDSDTGALAEIENSGKATKALIENWDKAAQAAIDYHNLISQAVIPDGSALSWDSSAYSNAVVTEIETAQAGFEDVEVSAEEKNRAMTEAVKNYLQNIIDSDEEQIAQLTLALSDLMSGYENIGKQTKDTKSKKDKSSTTKDPEIKKLKQLTEEVERYHEIEEALDDINRQLDRMDKTESRTYGKGKMTALKSKIEGYKNEAKALEEYNREAKSYLDLDKQAAQAAGWAIDDQGNVTNYDENMAAIVQKYNDTMRAYNSMTAEQQAEYKKQKDANGNDPLQAAEEEYKKALEALKQYEETADKYQDIQDKILENRRNIADAQLEEIELTVELNLEVDERNIALLEELFENIGDSADYVVDKIENIEKRIDAVVGKVETTRQAMKDTFDLLGEYNDNIDGGMLERMLTGNMTPEDLQNIADAVSNSDGVLNYDEIMSNIKDYADNLMEYNQELRDLRASVYDELENAMDKYSEEFDKVDDKIAHSKKMLSGYKDIVSALGKANVDPTGALTRRLNENTIKTNESDWRAANARQEAMKKAKADAEEGLRKAKESGSEYDIERWTKILEKAQEDLVSAEENAQDKLVEWIESIGEAFKAEIEQVIEDLDKELGSLTNLRENFDRQQTLNEQYVDDYEKIYQLSKMTRDINKTIDETDSVNAKKALMEFQQKINKYQEDGVQMSQYEVENLQRQLELEKAKIQLDEAKDEKSQVRMQRDAEGNYGYIYTANETDVAAAEQNYEDKLHEIQVANGNYINELQDSIITMQEECSAKIKEIMLDESLSMEERMAKVEETRDYYQKRLEYYSGQLGIVLDNNKELYENEWLEYSERTGYKISRNEDYVDSWQETSLGILTETENQAAYMERVEEAIGNATDRMAEAMENYQDRTSEAMDQAGYDIDNLAEDIGDRSNEVTEDAQNAADEAERLEDEYEQHLGDAMDATIDFTENYGQAIQDCIDENNRIIDSINDVIAALAEMASTAESSYNNINIPNVPNGGGSDTPGAGSDTPGAGSDTPGAGRNPRTKDYYVVIADTAGGKGNGHIYGFSGNHDKSDCESYLSQHKEDIIRTGNYNPRIVTRKSILGYDTGGYTGSWGSSEGKLAFLHQKELVLNAADTQNMLDIVDMVRDISRMIDINALSSMITSGLTTASVNTNNHDVIEQHVEITAEFHDATTATEITDAFENLINRATQYANRK